MSTTSTPTGRWTKQRLVVLALAVLAVVVYASVVRLRPARPDGRLRTVAAVGRLPVEDQDFRIERIRRIELPAKAIHFAVAGPVLYAAMGPDGLLTLDVSDPANPRVVHHVEGFDGEWRDGRGSTLRVYPEGDRLLVTDRRLGLSIYDATDPFRPTLQWNKPMPGELTDQVVTVTRVDETYYLACGGAGLRVLPVDFDAETEAPAVLPHFDHTYQSTFYPPHWLLVSDGYSTGMQVLDIRNPSEPRVTHVFGTNTYCDDVIPIGNYAVLINRIFGFTIADLHDPSRPFVANFRHTRIGLGTAIKAWVLWRDRYLLTGQENGAIEVFDLVDPERPTLVKRIEAESEVNPFYLNGDILYAGLIQEAALVVYRLGGNE